MNRVMDSGTCKLFCPAKRGDECVGSGSCSGTRSVVLVVAVFQPDGTLEVLEEFQGRGELSDFIATVRGADRGDDHERRD